MDIKVFEHGALCEVRLGAFYKIEVCKNVTRGTANMNVIKLSNTLGLPYSHLSGCYSPVKFMFFNVSYL